MNLLLKASLVLFLSGFFIGPIGDMYHVYTKTTGYPDHYAFYVFGIPWWVFPFFGCSGLAIGLGSFFSERIIFKNKISRYGEGSQARSLVGSVLFFFAYLLSGHLTTLKTSILLNNLILGSLTVLFWFFFDRSYRSALMAIVLAAIGILVETTLVSNGVFWYYPTDNYLFGVATWLPWLYMILAMGLSHSTNFMLKNHK